MFFTGYFGVKNNTSLLQPPPPTAPVVWPKGTCSCSRTEKWEGNHRDGTQFSHHRPRLGPEFPGTETEVVPQGPALV